MTERKVRWKAGDFELEVEGDETFVSAQLELFLRFVEEHGPRIDSSVPPVSLRSPSASAEASAQKARSQSPAEYIREKRPDTGTAQLVVLAKYLEDNRGQTEFAKADINAVASEAKLKAIHSQYFVYAVQQGLLRSVGNRKYAITLSGEDLVISLPKGGKAEP